MYRRSARINNRIDYYLLDLIFFALSYAIGYLLRFGWKKIDYLGDAPIRFGIIILVIYLVVALASRAYGNFLHRGPWVELVSAFGQIIATLVVFLLYLYVTKQSEILPRMMFGYMAVAALLLIWGARCIYKSVLKKHFINNNKLPHMLIVADSRLAEECIASINTKECNDFYLCGAVITDEDRTGEELNGCRVVADYKQLKEYVLANVVDQIYLAIADENKRSALTEYFLEAGIAVHIGLVGQMTHLPNPMLETIGEKSVITVSNNYASWPALALKRLADIVGAALGLIITGILYIIIAPQIRKADPGPALFRQIRIGKNGRQFYIYKFRSMYLDAEERKKELESANEMKGLMFKIEDDPRILPGIGHKIRDWSLDEFPQFWNVLKGDMSLVGTRPPTLDEFSHYEAHHKARLSFKPGITGLWQVSGRNRITDFEEIVRLDNEYIAGWNIWQDVKIIFRTIAVVFRKEGSM